ncbi:MAG: Na/Pi cotransporter family protein [Candidatus Diapherotrites archaeon]|jgi:phosphate:Na+ symporter|uniref:Na/Pi cotransporter family protein n=1 Tax=Candidatus Iainarchaeum sp. TaxID=3101447 RepID=A0A7K4BYI2_9ARCH|nr:Na/Pi cotransporter family protein [Candidatus Diapherotrites archaeon]
MFEFFSWELFFSIFAALALFLYGIDNFSKEVQKALGENFRNLLSKLTQFPVVGVFLGAIVTAIVQSSAATTVITVSLVNAGVLSFGQTLGIIIGSNIGTTITSQLVALNLTYVAPIFIVIGFVIDIFGRKYKFVGKPLFYFGLVFFSLNLLSVTVQPFVRDPFILDLFSNLSSPLLGVVVGFIFTVMMQSSSVTSGVIIVLAQSGLVTFAQGLPIILGANIGSTTTSLIASRKMDLFARRTAIAHTFFNVVGVLLILPFLIPFSDLVISFGGNEAQMIANAHVLFNVFTAIVFLIIINYWKKAIEFLVPGDEKEIVFKTKYLPNKIPEDTTLAFKLVESEMRNAIDITHDTFRAAVESLDTKDDLKKQNYLFSRVTKLVSLGDFINKKIQIFLFDISKRKLGDNSAQKLGIYVRSLSEIKRIQNLASDISNLNQLAIEKNANLARSYVVEFKEIYSLLDKNLEYLSKEYPNISKACFSKMQINDAILREKLTKAYHNQIKEISKESESTDQTFLELLSIIESAASRIRELRKMNEKRTN